METILTWDWLYFVNTLIYQGNNFTVIELTVILYNIIMSFKQINIE